MKKILIFVLTLILCCSLSFSALAADYGTEYPSYIPISGGAYFEVKSSVGSVSFVFPYNYKDGYFGFVGSGINITNICSGTINGTMYTSSGFSYSCRAQYGENLQYRSNSYPYEWVDVTTSSILNSNCDFIDLSDNDRQNDSIIYDFAPFQQMIAILLGIIAAFSIIKTICIRKEVY